jgi:cell division septal protein FtsQ
VRRKKTKFKPVKLLLKLVFVVLIISIAGRYLWEFLLEFEYLGLKIENVSIVGNSIVSQKDIMSVLKLQHGQNILKIDTGYLEEKLENLDRIKKAEIRRNYPDSLKIKIEEVIPVGYLKKADKRYVVTVEGKIFPGTEGSEIEFKVTDEEKLKVLAELLQKMKRVSKVFYDRITAIDISYRGEVITYEKSFYVQWPEASKINDILIDRIVYIIEKVEETSNGKKFEYIDVRFIEFVNGEIKGALIVK